ncbi:hypothetical protein LIA77_03253 [Sarocladium implicatum]|nr:hypothetical protein LIA77_03253 [Sarocladium implicatum]
MTTWIEPRSGCRAAGGEAERRRGGSGVPRAIGWRDVGLEARLFRLREGDEQRRAQDDVCRPMSRSIPGVGQTEDGCCSGSETGAALRYDVLQGTSCQGRGDEPLAGFPREHEKSGVTVDCSLLLAVPLLSTGQLCFCWELPEEVLGLAMVPVVTKDGNSVEWDGRLASAWRVPGCQNGGVKI